MIINIKKMGSALLCGAILLSSTACSDTKKDVSSTKEKETQKETKEDTNVNFIKASRISSPTDDEMERYMNVFYEKHKDFYKNTMREFLGGADSNVIYSPVNVYIALGMLTRCVDGDAQLELLNLLGDDSIDDVKENVKFLFEYLSVDEDRYMTTLANSIWLNSNVEFKEEVLKDLGKEYYSSSYTGEMGTEALNKMFRDWINDNTNNLLKEQVSNLELDSETVMAIVSTIYYKVEWCEKFTEELTSEGEFYSDSTIDCEYMHISLSMPIYYAEDFEAVAISTLNGVVWYFLPNEGVSPDSLLTNDTMYDLINGETDLCDIKYALINCSIPKCDLESQLDLQSKLSALGVNSIFCDGDFTPLTDENILVSEIIHGARLIVDEDGVEAAAFTEILMKNTALEPEEIIEFNCNRPFVTVITEYNVPIFTSVVNNPVA